MSFKDLFKVFRKENKKVKPLLEFNIYKDEKQIKQPAPIEKQKAIIENNYNTSVIKTDMDQNYMITPVSDYKYKEIGLTLYEQRDFYKKEKEKLQRLSEGMNSFKEYYHKISKITPLAKSADYNKVSQLKGLQLHSIIPTLRYDLGMLLSEYDKAIKNAAKCSYNTNIGIEGENKVDRELDLYRDKLLNMSNVRLETEGSTVESDNIIIAENGIFIIETKNFGVGHGGKIEVSRDGKWTRISAEGTVMGVDDITAQTYRHIGLTQRFLNEELRRQNINIPYVNINPIIVFVNPAINIDNQSDVPIFRVSNIYHHISTFKTDSKLDEKYWGVIENILDSHNKGAKPYPVKLCADKINQNYREVYNKLRFFDNIDKQVNLEKVLQQAAFEGNNVLSTCFEKYSAGKNDSRKVSHIEVISLRALIDDLDLRGNGDRGVYEGLILKYFNVDSLNDLTLEAYEYIYQALNNEIKRK